MSQLGVGDELELLTDLGNGFDVAPAQGKSPVLVGGGVGVPPLYGLARTLIAHGVTPSVVLGFRSAQDVFYDREFAMLGCPTFVATEDGSVGAKGYVTDVLPRVKADYVYACGPQPMLRAVHKNGLSGQLSFEERMGCGFGVCMGCTCETLVGHKRICIDGPVMKTEEVSFDD